MNAYYILGQHAHWNINKKLAKLIGLEAALLISDLISKREYFIQNKDLTIEDWFFNTQENIEVDTGLTPHQQRKCFNVLKENGFIETKLMSIPAKQHFKIIDNKLLKYLTTGCENIEELYNKNKDNKNKEITINAPAKALIPDFNEFKEFAISKKPNVDVNALKLKYDSWVQNGWKNGNDKKIKNWKSTLLNTLPYIKEAPASLTSQPSPTIKLGMKD